MALSVILKCLYSLAKNALGRSIVCISIHISATAYMCVVKGSRKVCIFRSAVLCNAPETGY